MSTQGTVTRLLPGSGGDLGLGNYAKGSSDDDSLNASFPSSPLRGTSVTVTDTYIKAQMQAVLNGTQTVNVDFSGVNMDYTAAPVLNINTELSYNEGTTAVTSGKGAGDAATAGSGGGAPANAFVPNTASPSDGTTGYASIPGNKAVPGDGTNGTTDYSATDLANYTL